MQENVAVRTPVQLSLLRNFLLCNAAVCGRRNDVTPRPSSTSTQETGFSIRYPMLSAVGTRRHPTTSARTSFTIMSTCVCFCHLAVFQVVLNRWSSSKWFRETLISERFCLDFIFYYLNKAPYIHYKV